ncbi:MAG: nucleotidyl transferase AbiEii/AbiGii toxin family protein [Terriglobales bacterium]
MKDLLATLARALDGSQIPYCVIGGQAVLIHGEPRFTRDIDLTLAIATDRLPEILAIAAAHGWRVLPADPAAFVAQHLVLPCEDPATGIRLDMIFGLTPFEQRATERSQPVAVAGTPVRFATPEDLIIHKLVAGRPRDIEDAASIVRKHPGLDWDYTLHWLEQFDRDLGTTAVNTLQALRRV